MSNTLIYAVNPIGNVISVKADTEGKLLLSQTDRLTDNDYFSGTLTVGDTTNVIDLGTRTNIQFGGKSTTSDFSFIIEYSSDNINFTTDGFEPQLTLVGTEYIFNLTRTNVCMRFVRLLCRNTGENVIIQVSAIQ